ncbi:MAG TPA: HEAT repeat domain-containing protein [Pyrinomonadaceae bacterium]
MRTTRYLKRLTNLTPLLLAGALVLAFGVAAHARQTAGRESKPATDAASLLAVLKATGSDLNPKEARALDDAVEGLKRMGRAAVPALTEFLNTEKGPGRVHAATALAGIDPSDALARRTLEDLARKGKGDDVIMAALALAEIDPENDAAVPALVKMASKSIWLPSRKALVRQRTSAQALALTAPGIKALTPLLNHWDSWVRQAAVFAFDERTETLARASHAVRAATREAIPALVKAIADKDEIVSGMAAESLEQLGADALPELKRAAASDDKRLSAAASELLKQMGRG